jgi:16S rRNA (cytosine1402-N4)-methyltransferase
VPVLVDEVCQGLDPQPGQTIVDGTLGGGGHARALAARVAPHGRMIGIDRDPAAIARAREALAGTGIECLLGNYRDLPELLAEIGVAEVDGVLLDLGLSSDQLADAERGFSFDADGPLDLRFDPTQGEPAWQMLERLSAERIADLIYEYGEERFSRRIGRAIVEAQRREPIRTARQLAELVRRVVPRGRGRQRIDPATRTFQALRIAVNEELASLETALKRLPECLKPGGRLAIISFHSLEDRRVKQAFRDDPRYEVITRRPIRPSETEIQQNPRARSAKLRVAARR